MKSHIVPATFIEGQIAYNLGENVARLINHDLAIISPLTGTALVVEMEKLPDRKFTGENKNA